jgi:hypothetical protein
MGEMKPLAAALAILSIASGTATVRAQTRPDAEAESIKRFKQGRAAIEAGDCAGAISPLRESLALNESVGAHASLAECLHDRAPLAAWRELKQGERVALLRNDDRAASLRELARGLYPRLALLEIRVPEDVAMASGLSVSVDGVTVDDVSLRDPVLALSPGAHRLAVSMPRRKTWGSR